VSGVIFSAVHDSITDHFYSISFATSAIYSAAQYTTAKLPVIV
jgi:hypothetical protein